jgi:hypothetical protein
MDECYERRLIFTASLRLSLVGISFVSHWFHDLMTTKVMRGMRDGLGNDVRWQDYYGDVYYGWSGSVNG